MRCRCDEEHSGCARPALHRHVPSISSTFQDTRLTNFLVSRGAGNFSAISYITNAVDTDTKGVDLVVNARHRFADGSLFTGTLAGNYTKTEFDRIAEVKGDTGAKHLLGEYAEMVCEVAIDDDAVLTDIDTPAALEAVRKET